MYRVKTAAQAFRSAPFVFSRHFVFKTFSKRSVHEAQPTGCAFFVMEKKKEQFGYEAAGRGTDRDSGSRGRHQQAPREAAEAAFLARASSLRFAVCKPWGDSERYDLVVDYGKGFWRVQVKATSFHDGLTYQVVTENSKGRKVHTGRNRFLCSLHRAGECVVRGADRGGGIAEDAVLQSLWPKQGEVRKIPRSLVPAGLRTQGSRLARYPGAVPQHGTLPALRGLPAAPLASTGNLSRYGQLDSALTSCPALASTIVLRRTSMQESRKIRLAGLLILLTSSFLFTASAFAGNDVLGEIDLVGASKVEKTSGVWVDGQYVGYLHELKGSKKILLLPGEHEITVRQGGYLDFVQTVSVRAGDKQTIGVKMAKDTRVQLPEITSEIKLDVNRIVPPFLWTAFLCGHVAEFGGIGRALLVAPGKRKVRITLPGYQNFETDIELVANQKSTIKTDLVKGGPAEGTALSNPY